ncbi:MAG: 2-hydroxychromene-2-carboxylate isomerase [Gammaproteobacteria bacterium]|nr:2-hydroxychromene-2-carboxylate isomerase [Gammaproteobacteria bacterium]
MADIEYYYSAHSAYAYLGSSTFMKIAAAAGRAIVHKPVDLNKVIAAAGSTAFGARTDAYRQYFFMREIQRWSEEREAPVFGRPTYHHHDTTLANCMLIAGAQSGANIDQLAHVILEGHWRFDADHADPQTLERLGREAGYDAQAFLDAATSQSVVKAYNLYTEEAIERSVFGSPTYFADGDMFYGQDRLEMLQRALTKPYSREWSA